MNFRVSDLYGRNGNIGGWTPIDKIKRTLGCPTSAERAELLEVGHRIKTDKIRLADYRIPDLGGKNKNFRRSGIKKPMNLDTPIADINFYCKKIAKRLNNLELKTARDLLFYYPFRYEDWSKIKKISELVPNEPATVKVKIEQIKNFRSPRMHKKITEAIVRDETGKIKVLWFNQWYITNALLPGDDIYLAARINDDGDIVSPGYEKFSGNSTHTGRIVPIYPLTKGLTQKHIRSAVKSALQLLDDITDYLPEEIKQNNNLADLKNAVLNIHFPASEDLRQKAVRRLSFDELFLMQAKNLWLKCDLEKRAAAPVPFHQEATAKFVDSLPFKLTEAQRRSAWEILKDIQNPHPMNRLLDGDVGSGKTLVAALAMYNTALSKMQSALLAPTEILASQHYDTFCKLFNGLNIKIGLVTHSKKITNYELRITNKKPEKITLSSDIVIGTHALIQEDIKFTNLALAVVDEQHRFGVTQRAALSARTNTDCTPTNTDTETDTGLLYEDITYKIRGAVFAVKKQLGLGHKENIYQKALEEEFKKVELIFKKEVSIDISYNDKKIGVYRPDFIINEEVILEIKALPNLGKFETQQVWHYLKGSKYKLALLANFGRDDIEIKRFIHTDSSPRKSASSPHKSAFMPHLLSMTATPIPRTLALISYGDLDLSILDEMPQGRKEIKTYVVAQAKRAGAYDFIRKQIQAGRQAFVICPLIDESDKLGVKSVAEEYKKLNEQIFPEFQIGMLHGKLKSAEKDEIMKDFKENKTKILVSTSVVEVGVDIPNATIMMIEGAERFGLAQLHQFRGRVGRSGHQSYCLLFPTDNTTQRLKAMETINDGFKLAEIDLQLRGPGKIYGTEQSGRIEFQLADIKNIALLKQTQDAANNLFKDDPELKKYPPLREYLEEKLKKIHLE